MKFFQTTAPAEPGGRKLPSRFDSRDQSSAGGRSKYFRLRLPSPHLRSFLHLWNILSMGFKKYLRTPGCRDR